MDEKTFDLRDALLGRSYPETSIRVWLEEEPWFKLSKAEKRAADAASQSKELSKAEKEIVKLQEQIDASAYTVHLRGISGRSGEDIISRALIEKPIKRDMLGREDDLQQIERTRLISELSFSQHITKIVAPDGSQQVLDDENRRDIARAFLQLAPKSAVKVVDETIAALSRDFSERQAELQNPDFS